jgi:S-formylglutathione hydrolase
MRPTFATVLALALLLGACASPVSTPSLTPAIASPPARTVAPTPTDSLVPGPTATRGTGTYASVKLESAALAKNLIDEPAEHSIRVYLPPGYESSRKHYPVVYYLPGYDDTQFGAALPVGMDTLLQQGAVQEMIIVMVPGRNRLGGSFYVNSPVTGNWEDYITQEVVGYIDSTYRTLPRAESRGITGHSMGGFGALNIAMHHPDLFSAVYSLSPGLFDENGLGESQMFTPLQIAQSFLNLQKAILTKPQDQQQKLVLTALGNFTAGYGMAFAPDPQNQPFYFDYPYDDSSGELVRDEAVWNRWEAGYGGIPEEIAQYRDNLLKLNGIVVDYGTNDEYRWIPKGCVYFDEQMTEAGIPHEMAPHDGTHQSALSERVLKHALPYLSAKLAGE